LKLTAATTSHGAHQISFHCMAARTSMTTITVCSTPSQGTMPRLLFTWTGCLGQTRITARQRLLRRREEPVDRQTSAALVASRHAENSTIETAISVCMASLLCMTTWATTFRPESAACIASMMYSRMHVCLRVATS